MRVLLSTLVAFVAALEITPCGARTPPTTADAPLTEKHLVRINNGRRMNIVCAGTGAPTVIFETGLGANLLTWQKLAAPVSHVTRACFYDRAGYGYSDPSRTPSTATSTVEDLHQLLRRAHVRRPVVLVAHSIGGLYATLYADLYRDDVAGLVLIDPSFAEQDKNESASERATDEAAFRDNVLHLRTCASLARSGKLGLEKHPECFEFAPERTPEEKAFLTYQMVRPDRYEAMASEANSLHSSDGRSDTDSRQETAARQSFGDKPVTVLTAALFVDPKAKASDLEIADHNWRSWKAGHDALAARSERGKSTVVADTDHFIQVSQPSAVISAINDVVAAVRRGR